MNTHPTPSAHSTIRLAAALAGVALAAAPPLAAEALKTASGDLLLASGEGRSIVQRPDGSEVELPLSKAARVSDFRAAETGWFVAAVAHDSGGPRLEVLAGSDHRVDSLPAPALAGARQVAQPIFVADKARVHALVWLEGDAHNQHAVRAARWLGDAWGATEVVSPPGPGTQIALSTAALADGTWLIAWAAFDGVDDEILWSRWANGAWSAPRPVAAGNRVPDITPSLYPTDGGALLAWSRFDGSDYRVNVSRFDGDTWSTPSVVGAKGSTAPAFSAADTPYVIYQHAAPRAWAVVELDAAGQVQRRAKIEDPRADRPFVAGVSENTVTLEWAGVDAEAFVAPLAWRD